MIKLNVKLLTNTAVLPKYGHEDSTNSGLDICADGDFIIMPKCKKVISTGIAISMEHNAKFGPKVPGWFKNFIQDNYKFSSFIKARSGLSAKHSIEHGAGVVDQGYRGECKVILHNHGWLPKRIKKGERVAQLVCMLLPNVEVNATEDLSITDRGVKGFGSSGRV